MGSAHPSVAPIPAHEDRRLDALRRYEVLDTAPEAAFDGIARLAARVLGTPMALVSLVDESRQWFKARVGITTTQTSRDVAFCAHAVAAPGDILEVRDAAVDPRFADNPFVVDHPHVRFYAGAPLITPEGDAIGTLCVLDREVRELTAQQREDLRVLADLVVTQLELRRLASELRDEEERMEALLQHASDVVTVLDDSGTVRYASPATNDLIGVPPEDRLGRTVLDILHPDDEPLVRAWFVELLRVPGSTARVDARLRHADGTWRHVEAVAVNSLHDPAVSGIVLTIRDVTARRRAEEATANARDEAMRSSALKSNFLATMSHEIRTPLNAVIGMTGLLLDTELDDNQRLYARSVRTAGESLLTLLNDILDLSKIEAGRAELELLDFELATVVEDVADLFAETARSKSIELMVFTDVDLPNVVHGDPSRLRQVLTNLLGNAVKFTQRGEVVVSATQVRSGGGHDAPLVRFEVRDTGIGMSQAQRDRLFEPFAQADASTTRRFGGTGLGLAISRELVALMGGELTVESEQGVGSTFAFSIPLPPVATRAAAPDGLRGRHVLVVDDNATNCLLLERMLEQIGLRVTTSTSAGDALPIVASTGCEIVVTDLHMPGIDGLELAAGIRGIPVILLTSGGMEPRTLPDSIVARLSKPVRLSELVLALARALALQVDDDQPELTAERSFDGRHGGGRRVLVVEDHAVNQLVMARVLEKLGYVADVAGNGLEAVEAVASVGYDAVLMDVQMPELDGYGATRRIRALEQAANRRRVPIIAMTASAIAGEQERCLAAGMDDYLSKPVRPPDVAHMLQRWITVGTEGLVDRAQFDMLRVLYGDERELDEAVAAFGTELHALVSGILDALAVDDTSTAARLAHTLAGSAGTLGSSALAAEARNVEQALDGGDVRTAVGIARAMTDLCDRSVAQLASLVDGG
ncbi:MAG TPA: response regulator [Acidimicrobiales bacterium]|nr:response regulator [Acidimicrobiales bacterium]